MGYAERLVKTAVQHQHAEGYEGSLLMDAPNLDWQNLQERAKDKSAWKDMVKKLKPPKAWSNVGEDESSEEVDYSPKPGEHAEPNWEPMTLSQLHTQLQYQFPPPKPQV